MDKRVAAGMALLEEKETPEREKEARAKPTARRYVNEGEVLAKVADKGFLRSYVDNCRNTTDAPPEYHIAVGLSILGAAMGNSVRIRAYGGLTVFPNLWMLLIAPSGLMRKSTALYIGKNLLQDSVPMRVLPDDWTPEKLIDVLTENPAGLLVVSEFTRLLEQFNKEYMGGAMQMLTELHDNPSRWVKERTKTKKKIIEEPAVSLLGATTLDWLQESVQAKDLRGGFLARFLFLPATDRGQPVKLQSASRHAVWLAQKDHLVNVAELRGEANYDDVFDVYEDWLGPYQMGAEMKMRGDDRHADLIGLYSRSGVTALRLAMIFQASRRPQLRVTPEAMKDATTFLEYVHQATSRVAMGFTDSWVGSQRQKVLQLVEAHGEMKKSELLRKLQHLKVQQLDSILTTLLQAKMLRKETKDSEGGRRAEVFRLY